MAPLSQALTGDLSTVVNSLQALTVKLGDLIQQIQSSTAKIFPQTSGTSASASAGTGGALPTQVAGYLTVTLANGQSVKVPYYN